MKCHIAENLITRFCESHLDSMDDRKLFQHLDRCTRCRNIVWGIGERLRVGALGEEPAKVKREINRLTTMVLENFYQ